MVQIIIKGFVETLEMTLISVLAAYVIGMPFRNPPGSNRQGRNSGEQGGLVHHRNNHEHCEIDSVPDTSCPC